MVSTTIDLVRAGEPETEKEGNCAAGNAYTMKSKVAQRRPSCKLAEYPEANGIPERQRPLPADTFEKQCHGCDAPRF